MNKIILSLLLLPAAHFTYAQHYEETYPKTLWSPNDTFILKYKDNPQAYPYRVSDEDQPSPGTDGQLGLYATLYYGKDSLRLNYNNKLPYAHIIYVRFESPKGKSTFRFHFNDVGAYFSPEYREKNKGNTRFDIPEVYELANIIWTLSPSGQRAKDLNKESEYYQKVMAYFKPYMKHPLLKALDLPDSVVQGKYYEFRENSLAFNFRSSGPGDTKLLFNGPYYYVWGDELADSSFFGKLLPLVEDFAARSGFRKFYKTNLSFYNKEIAREKELLPVKQMWSWLEDQFPKTKYNAYHVVFSPLIGGSHSTQRFASFYKTDLFIENVMFICDASRYDKMPGLTEKQKEGLMSGIVFTEIDHNYVNPATGKYRKQVDSVFSNRDHWVKKGNGSDFYGSNENVFNEYMTWSVFCLYIIDSYDKATADIVIEERESRMVDKRNFIRFREFNQELIRLRQENKDRKVADLYPLILEWCKKQQGPTNN